jgi:hypothetical protein
VVETHSVVAVATTRRRTMEMTGGTYFIQSSESGAIKIGTSSVVSSRLTALQTANPHKLVLLGVSAESERVLHREFASDRLAGEWFNPSDRLCRWILSHFTLDANTLESFRRHRKKFASLVQEPETIEDETRLCDVVLDRRDLCLFMMRYADDDGSHVEPGWNDEFECECQVCEFLKVTDWLGECDLFDRFGVDLDNRVLFSFSKPITTQRRWDLLFSDVKSAAVALDLHGWVTYVVAWFPPPIGKTVALPSMLATPDNLEEICRWEQPFPLLRVT